MSDDADRAYQRVVKATERMDKAWKNRSTDRAEMEVALKELNEAGVALANAWNEQDKPAG